MQRRTVLRSLAAVIAARPLSNLDLLAEAQADLTDANIAALKAIAEVVLPAALGQKGRDAEVARFVSWVRNYRAGADRGGGYGNARLTPPTGPSPATGYPAQFAALDKAASAQGAASLAALAIDTRRVVIETALNQPQRVTQLPGRPNGANVIADFMGYYFGSAGARDLCYNAAIGRETCRGLEGSEKAPAPLGAR
jgi:hypothetical protein